MRHKQHETVNCDSSKKQDTKNILTNNSDTTLRILNEFLRLCTWKETTLQMINLSVFFTSSTFSKMY